jgi:hypothetical protein
VKDEGSNLNIVIIVLRVVVSYDILGLKENYQGTCSGHAFSKACQYVTTNEKKYKKLTYVFIKITQKKSIEVYHLAKKIQERLIIVEQTCVEFGLAQRKFNTSIKTR